MRRFSILTTVGVLMFTAGVLGLHSRMAESTVPVTPYEADVNKNGQVNSIDLMLVAQRFGQAVPTATPNPTDPHFAFSGMSCANDTVTGNLAIPAGYRASNIQVAAFDGTDTSAIAYEKSINYAGFRTNLSYAGTFPASMPISIPLDSLASYSHRTAQSVLVVVLTWDSLFHEYTVIQCPWPITPTPQPTCPSGSTDIGSAISPPSANGHFCATFTPTFTATLTPTITPTPGGPTNTPAAGGQDILPPTIVAFDFTPKSVDTTNSSQQIVVTAHLSDALSGVNYLYVQFRAPTSSQRLDVFLDAGARVSGTVNDGSYQTGGILPAYSEYGTWSVSFVTVVDNLGNSVTLDAAQYAALGFPTSFHNGP